MPIAKSLTSKFKAAGGGLGRRVGGWLSGLWSNKTDIAAAGLNKTTKGAGRLFEASTTAPIKSGGVGVGPFHLGGTTVGRRVSIPRTMIAGAAVDQLVTGGMGRNAITGGISRKFDEAGEAIDHKISGAVDSALKALGLRDKNGNGLDFDFFGDALKWILGGLAGIIGAKMLLPKAASGPIIGLTLAAGAVMGGYHLLKQALPHQFETASTQTAMSTTAEPLNNPLNIPPRAAATPSVDNIFAPGGMGG